MKSKPNPFHSSAALSGAAIVFACFTLLKPSAQAADQLWIGAATDDNVTTATNWVGAAPSVDTWQPFIFGSDVVNGNVNLDRWVAVSSLTLTSGLTHDITINNGPIVMGGSLVDMSTAGANLTLNAQLQQAWGDMTFNVGAGRTLTAAGGVAESGWFGLHTGLTKNGAGTAVIPSALSYTLGTTVNGGTLQMPDGSWVLNGVAHQPITVNAGATFNTSSGASEFAVGPTLNGGTINSRGLDLPGRGNWGNILLDAGLQITAGGAAVSTIASQVSITGNTTFSVGSGSTLNMTGPVVDSPWGTTGVIKSDDGTLTLSSATNDYTCGTTISGGTLAFGGAGQLGGGNYGGNILNHGALVYGSSAAQTLSGAISGRGSLTQSGSGTLTLSGTNTYGGATTVNAGTLEIGNAAAVGGTSGITVNSGGSLYFDSGTANGSISAPMSLNGDGGGNAALDTSIGSGQITFTGPITLLGGSLVRAIGDHSTLNFTNAIHGTGSLAFAGFGGGAGTKDFMVLSGTSDFTGDLWIVTWFGAAQVTLSGGDNRLPTTTLVAVKGTSGMPGALDLNGNNQTIAGLTDAIGWGGMDGTRCVVNTSSTAVTLTLNTNADESFAGTVGGTDINGATGNNFSLVKSGAGTQTLSGAITYSGNTTVNGGTLSLGQANPNNESSTVSIAATAGAKLNLAFYGTDTVDKMYINGVQQPAGSYTSSHPSGAFTGSGTLHVISGPAGFGAWQAANNTTGAIHQDHDNDGVANGIEYFLGGNTDTTGFTALPSVAKALDGTFSVTWTKGNGYAGIYNTDYAVETSTALNGDWQVETLGGGQVTDAPGYVKYTFPVPIGGKKFARLKVTGP
ncbi:MAG: autotransporter-associated beta strand repeat-containing protein [Verrucomicrobiota bacterium]